MLLLVPALLTTFLAATPTDGGLLSSPERRVRSTDRRITELLEIGFDRSPTFANLVRSVNATDVIVYIERARGLPTALAGRLLLLPLAAGQHRYLRIQVRADLPSNDLIALIGHELRHALEIAEEPWVRDSPAMLHLYQRIGRPTPGTSHSYDTIAAQTAGQQVRLELAS
jgi:hypothetical protein